MPASYHGLPDWISEVWRFSDLTSEFDMSPIRPSEVKQVLKNVHRRLLQVLMESLIFI